MNDWIKQDLKYIWHPYTQMKDCETMPPIFISKAKGMKIHDDKGNEYYDTIASWWCNIHGHNHPDIIKAINKQLETLDHVLFAGFTHEPAIQLAQRLVEITPDNLSKVFFSDNGSTAVETALKMSFQYWLNKGVKDKTKFVSLDYGYHGDTIGTMSLGGVDLFNNMFSPLFYNSFKVPSPYCYRCPMGKEKSSCSTECIKPLEKLLKDKGSEISALILEPLVLAAGGMIVYPAEYLKKAAVLAKENNVHFIVDEVATGFGRTGKMFALEYADIMPDFLCLSKGITSGTLALGVTLTTEHIYEAFYAEYNQKKTFYHGHTFTANPISCSAALATLDIFKKEDTLNKANKVIPLIHEKMEEFRSIPIVGDVRYIGMIGAIELVENRDTKKPFSFEERMGTKIYIEGLKKGLVLRPLGNIVYLYLPLIIQESEVNVIMKKTFDVLKKINNDLVLP
jgi:adenosylmethionine-8-amino-7-oxononanoate aminotransferase